MRKIANIKNPLEMDWKSEITTNGEKSVPDIRLVASALKTVSAKKDGKERFKAERTAIFESPSRKNGTKRGISSSAYEKSSVMEIR